MAPCRFLLLDTGPILKLMEDGLWEAFITKYQVTVSQYIASESVYFEKNGQKEWIDPSVWQDKRIGVVDVSVRAAQNFLSRTNLAGRVDIHEGELTLLVHLEECSQDCRVCSADGAVFVVLGMLGRGDQGMSLEEALGAIGLSRKLAAKFTKGFRQKYTRIGEAKRIEGTGNP